MSSNDFSSSMSVTFILQNSNEKIIAILEQLNSLLMLRMHNTYFDVQNQVHLFLIWIGALICTGPELDAWRV